MSPESPKASDQSSPDHSGTNTPDVAPDLQLRRPSRAAAPVFDPDETDFDDDPGDTTVLLRRGRPLYDPTEHDDAEPQGDAQQEGDTEPQGDEPVSGVDTEASDGVEEQPPVVASAQNQQPDQVHTVDDPDDYHELELDLTRRSEVDPDVWAWAHEAPDEHEPMLSPQVVTALLVVHQAAEWLPRTLASLRGMEPRPATIVAVDTGSTDQSGELLRQAHEYGLVSQIITLADTTLFAEAVNTARSELGDKVSEWLWLLPDDVEPTRHSLAGLLTVAAQQPNPDIVVPALLHPKRRNHPDQIQEVGQSIARTGTRLTGADPGDIDQQQVESQQVLGGSSAGLLVRTGLFDELGGLNEAFPHREGLELSWRARDHGAVVVTAPRATLHHRQAGLSGMRDAVADKDPVITDRLSGMRLVAVRSKNVQWAVVGLVLSQLGRMFGLLLGRAPRRALEEGRALREFLASRSLVHTLRGKLPKERARVDGYRPGLWGTLVGGIATGAAGVGSRVVDLRSPETSIDELTGDDFAGSGEQSRLLRPGVVWATLAVLGVAAAIQLVIGHLVATNLLPSPTWRALWSAWWQPNPGISGAPAPWLGFSALGATLTLGHPGIWAWLLLVLAVLIAARGGYSLLGEMLGLAWDSKLRMGLASLWGLVLVWLGIAQRGEFGTLAIVVTAAWFGLACHRWHAGESEGAAGWRAPAAMALIGCLWLSIQPLLWFVVAGALLIVAVRRRAWVSRGSLLQWAFLAISPIVFVAAWIPRWFQAPARMLTSADPFAAPFSSAGGPLALLGRVSSVAALPNWLVLGVGGLFWLSMLAVVVMRGGVGRKSDAALGLVASALLVIGAWLPRISLRIDGEPLLASGSAFIALGVGLAGLVAARIATRDQLATVVPPARTLLAGVAAVLSVVLGLSWVILQDQPASSTSSVLPSWITDAQNSPRASRTLLLDLTASPVQWNLTDAHSPEWGSGEQGKVLTGTPGANVEQLAASISAGKAPEDVAKQLTDLGIAAVWVNGDNGALDGATGLQSTSQGRRMTVYSVAGLVSRAVLDQAGAAAPITESSIDPVAVDSQLIIAEPRDARWRATVGGTDLAASGSGWQQQFTVPSGVGGDVKWYMKPATGAALIEGLVLLILLIMAAPAASSSSDGPRRAQQEGQGRNRGGN